MNYSNLFGIIIIIAGIFAGYKKGFISITIDLVALMISLYFGFYLRHYAAVYINDCFPVLNEYNPSVAFLTTTFIFLALYSLLFTLVKTYIPNTLQKHRLNRWAGVIPGIAYSISVIIFLLQLVTILPLGQTAAADINTSVIRRNFPSTLLLLPDNRIKEQVFSYENIAGTGTNTSPHKSIILPFSTTNFTERKDLEKMMLDLVNTERIKNHLSLLREDTAIKRVATAHSTDMLERGYFAHNTPEGIDPFIRMQMAGISYTIAGENLALSHNLYKAHEQLMLSPAHRANILNAAFGRLGIAVIDAGDYGLMIAQEFRN